MRDIRGDLRAFIRLASKTEGRRGRPGRGARASSFKLTRLSRHGIVVPFA